MNSSVLWNNTACETFTLNSKVVVWRLKCSTEHCNRILNLPLDLGWTHVFWHTSTIVDMFWYLMYYLVYTLYVVVVWHCYLHTCKHWVFSELYQFDLNQHVIRFICVNYWFEFGHFSTLFKMDYLPYFGMVIIGLWHYWNYLLDYHHLWIVIYWHWTFDSNMVLEYIITVWDTAEPKTFNAEVRRYLMGFLILSHNTTIYIWFI